MTSTKKSRDRNYTSLGTAGDKAGAGFDWTRDDLPKPPAPDRTKALAERLAPDVRRACELFAPPPAGPAGYADKEWRRFCSVAVPSNDGLAWIDPAALADPEARAALDWSVGLRERPAEAGPRPPDDLPDELRPFAQPDDRGSLGFRAHLARVRRFAVMKQGR